MRILLMASLLAAVALRPAGEQSSSRYVSVTIKAQRQGFLRGGNQKHEMVARSFREVASEAPGARSFEVSFEFDGDLERALQAMSTHEVVSEASFDFGRPDKVGRDTVYAQLKLANAYITSFDMVFAKGHEHVYVVTLTAPAAAVNVQNGGQTMLPPLTSLGRASGIPMSANGVSQALVSVPSFHDDEYPADAQKAPPNLRHTAEADSFELQGHWQGNSAVFQPLLIVKQPGAASSDFQQASHSGTVLHQVNVDFNGPDRTNAIHLQCRIEGLDAKVTGFQVSSDQRGRPEELIRITPRQAQIEDEVQHTTTQVNWQ